MALSEHFVDEVAEDWEQVDNTIGKPWGPGEYTVVNDSYHFESSDEVFFLEGEGGIGSSLFANWLAAEQTGYENAVLRVTGRAGEAGNHLMHGLRVEGLWAYAFRTNEPGEFQISSFRGQVPDVAHVTYSDEQTRFRPGEDWIIEGAVIEDRISMKVWREGDHEPEVPQLTYVDPDPIRSGKGVLIGGLRDPDFPGEAKINLTFDEVHFRTVEGWVDGDFSINQQLGVADINGLSHIVRTGTNDAYFDLNGDEIVDPLDRDVWVHELKATYFGDANLDGEFNSGDLVALFTAGEFEDGMPVNSNWATGDFDGDGDFDSGDLVAAFIDGGFELGPRVPAGVVPEPTGIALVIVGLVATVSSTRRRGRPS